MGKLINMMQSNLFGKKKTLGVNGVTSNTASNTSCVLPPVTFTIDNKKDCITNSAFQGIFTNIATENKKEEALDVISNQSDTQKLQDECVNQQNTEEKLYELERCYLFEQNNIIDKYENEKSEMLEKHAEEKLLAKRAYDHEKDELLKEIERKDKMLFELTNIMREECTSKLEEQKAEFVDIIENKHKLYADIEVKLKSFIETLTNFFKNNERLPESVTQYKELLEEYGSFVKCIDKETRSTNVLESTQIKYDIELNFPLRSLDRQLSDPSCSSKPKFIRANSYDHENLNSKRQASGANKVVSRTLSDNVRLNNDCCRKHCRDRNNSDEAIQHELAQAYRKQKTELLRLFNSEKEQYEKKINKDKDNFERETRAEYVKRMSVERKAWQETIEDYEREVSILKYERQQMDTNYCIGMDKMKTEFEREKNAIHRRYNESCLQLKRNLEEKLKNAKIVDGHSEEDVQN